MHYQLLIIPTFYSCNMVTRLDSSLAAVVITSSAGESTPALGRTTPQAFLLVFSALRAYALGRKKWISVLVLCLGSGNAATSLVSSYTFSTSSSSCFLMSQTSMGQSR